MTEFLHHYVEIMSDPAHMAAEITFMLVLDVLVLGLLWPLARRVLLRSVDRRIRAEHRAIEAEHGITHDEPRYREAKAALELLRIEPTPERIARVLEVSR